MSAPFAGSTAAAGERFEARIVAAPRPANRAVAAEMARLIAPGLGVDPAKGDDGDTVDPRVALAAGAGGGAPFLARLLRREADWVADPGPSGPWAAAPDATLEGLRQACADAVRDERSDAEAMAGLRAARRRAALFIALADLGGVWRLDQVAAALTRFAEAALQAALARLLRAEAAAGAIPGLDPERSGVFALAMGKMGACELNYSSDIDIILLFDPARLPPASRAAAQERFPRLARGLTRLLAQIDADGYVARVDLRLRPDPGSTAPVLSTESALRYYQTHGRAWERAAHVKARPAAGDLAAGDAYLAELEPFIWRRRVDFAAMEDAGEMLAKIRAHAGSDAAFAGRDLKLDPGGVREIEFLAQTYQLIHGGREEALRAPGTRQALAALAEAGRMEPDTARALDGAYEALRNLEHRIQMIEDQQTHRVPRDGDGLARLAGLSGQSPDAAGAAALERAFEGVFRTVRAAASPRFDQAGEDAPGAAARDEMEALRSGVACFSDAERALAVARPWFEGDVRALRHPRARARLRRLAPELLARLGAADDPQAALTHFDRFLRSLPDGVRVLSLLEADAAALRLVVEICAAAPRLAQELARRAQLLDAALDKDFFDAPPALAEWRAQIDALLSAQSDEERMLDAARRWGAEQRFQISAGLVQGRISTAEAMRDYTDVAEAAIGALWAEVAARHAARHGPAPGAGATVLALGRMGSREMTAGSDVDLIVVYDAAPDAVSTGARPLPAPQYYARLTQALTRALSAPTAEGALYEVDMRLRPSGRAGPLATSLSAFARYQQEEAWTWEHMALTRARAVAGAPDVGEAALAAAVTAMGRARNTPPQIFADAAAMRAKFDAANPKVLDDPWAFKATRGGLIDLEYIAQTGLLAAGVVETGLAPPEGFAVMRAAGALEPAEADSLTDAYRLMASLLTLTRMAVDGAFRPETAGRALAGLISENCEIADLATLESRLREIQAMVRATLVARLGPV
ncbi:MAG: bifunctional [glutamine synthetase] adenylyltransferase/[glutamine synthetase]-adenylyl-L-tyrosine phosphorylase [Pseudomonadota bacterium]